jgi:predicted nucleic acid-binding protein
MAWCIDANIFIESAHVRLPHDIFPAFWDALHRALQTGQCVAIAEVKNEITKVENPLTKWAKTAPFVANDDASTIAAMEHVVRAVEAHLPAYRDHAKTKFLDCADPWVIAFCKAHGHTLVTHEVSAPKSLTSVKIPDIAHAVGVTVVGLNGMLRALQIKFH